MEESADVSARRMVRWAWRPGGVGALARAYLQERRFSDADRVARARLRAAQQTGERGVEGHLRKLLGEIASHPDCLDVAAAEGHYRDAMTLAETLGWRPLLAHCHLGLGTLQSAKGAHASAHDSLATAAALFAEMQMGSWANSANAAMEDRTRSESDGAR
jgi:hypothetical protein